MIHYFIWGTAVAFLAFSFQAKANMMGISTHPIETDKHLVNTDFNAYMSNGSGSGINARYFYKANEQVSLDIGLGVSEGDRASRIFAGSDFEFLPDYDNQPRMSIKALAETSDEFEQRHYKFGVAPTISKGFNFWGKEGFPFIALPVMVDLNDERDSYKMLTSLAAGVTTYTDMNNLIFNVEANIGLSNSYNSIIAGLSMTMD